MADEFGGIGTRSEVLRIVSQISHASKEGGLWRGNTMTVNRARRVGRRQASVIAATPTTSRL
jgi:hypothetical protein